MNEYGESASKPTWEPSTRNARPPPGESASSVKLVLVVAPSAGAVTVGGSLLIVTVTPVDCVELQPLPSQSAAVNTCESEFARPHVGHCTVALVATTATGAPISTASA